MYLQQERRKTSWQNTTDIQSVTDGISPRVKSGRQYTVWLYLSILLDAATKAQCLNVMLLQ